jgi:hypothetical protein
VNRRTSKLLRFVAVALIQGRMVEKPGSQGRNNAQLVNPATRLARKLKREWNLKPRPVRNTQRLALIRTLVQLEGSHVPA